MLVKGCKHKACLTLTFFKKGRIFIVQNLLWHGTSVYTFSFEDPPRLVASYKKPGEYWVPILTQIMPPFDFCVCDCYHAFYMYNHSE